MDDPTTVGDVEANKEGKHLVDNRQIIFDDMNHLQSCVEPYYKARWGNLSDVEKNLIKRAIANKEGKHLVDNSKEIIFDDKNHLESFLDSILHVRWGSPESTLDKSDTSKYVSIEE